MSIVFKGGHRNVKKHFRTENEPASALMRTWHMYDKDAVPS